jgi:hypothetical protein
MDPYLESPAHWSDFHGHFVPQLAEQINQCLPDNYVARIGRHVSQGHVEAYLQIVELPAQARVMVIELMSPSKKRGEGRDRYVGERQELLRQPVSLLELDFLRGGARVIPPQDLPTAHYYAFLSRSHRTLVTEVWAWNVRDSFPALPMPLGPTEPDVVLDLQGPFAAAYERGRYWKLIDYAESPPPPAFGCEDADWVTTTARGGGGTP